MTTRPRRSPVRWTPVGILALVTGTLLAVPSGTMLAPPPGVTPSAATAAPGPAATVPVRPVASGTRIVGGRQGGAGSLALGLTLADLTAPGGVVPPAARPSAAPLPAVRVPALPRITTTAKPGTASLVAIAFAMAQRGLPYVWGGDGPQAGEAGFDCSGLTTAAYDYAGISLPRTAHTQYYEGPHVPAGAPLEPGDLVFYGVPERVHHVGLYLGNGRMINAPTFGRPVRTAFVRYPGDDYLGATRPAAGRDAPGLLHQPDLPVPVPPVPAPEVPPAPTEFMAPPAPDVPQLAAAPTGAPATDPTTDPVAAAAGSPAPTSPGATPSADAATTTPATTTAPADGTTATSPAATATRPTPTDAATTTTAPAGAASTSPRAGSPSTTPSATAPTTTTSTTTTTTTSAAAPTTASRGGPGPAAGNPTPQPALAPNTVSLPGGETLRLIRTPQGGDGLPAAPSQPGTATLVRSDATTVITLPSDAGTVGLTRGGTIQLTDADGNPAELDVRDQRTVNASTAADLVAAGRRQVLLVVPRDDGEVLVVIAS